MPDADNDAKACVRSPFDTEHLKTGLRGRSVRGGVATMLGQGAHFIIHTASTIILARLLTPSDFGLIAMVTAVTGFASLFKDLGLSAATIQKAEITHEQISTLFWVNVAVSTLIALVTAALAPAIALFYAEPRLVLITLALSLVFLFGGLTVQHQALLQRQMRFTALAAIQVISILAGVIAAIAAAARGVGYWTLVIMQVVNAMFIFLGVWLICGWRPGLRVRGSGVLAMVKFGGHITGFDIVNYFARNLDNILLGRFWGASTLGLYSRAYNIMMLPINQIRVPLNNVAMSALSHLQNDPIRFKRYYIKLITLIAFIAMPLMVFLFVCGDQVIYLLLGSQWSGAIVIFKILCINAFIQPTMSTGGLVLISLGQSKRYLTVGIINSIIIVISFVFGLPWGATGIATAYTIATYVILVPTLWYSYRRSPIRTRDFFSAILRPVIASAMMGFGIFVFRLYLTGVSSFVSIGCSFIIGFLTYIAVLFFIPGGLSLLREFFSYRSFLFQKSP